MDTFASGSLRVAINPETLKPKRLRKIVETLGRAAIDTLQASTTFADGLTELARDFSNDDEERLKALLNEWDVKLEPFVALHRERFETLNRRSHKQIADATIRLLHLLDQVRGEDEAFKARLTMFASRCPPAVESAILDLMSGWTAAINRIEEASHAEVARIAHTILASRRAA